MKNFGLGDTATYAPIADFTLLSKAVEAAREHGIEPHVGNILSSDPFYSAEGCSKNDQWKRMGVLAVEMEAAGLYANAAYAHKRALCICTISDHLYRPEDNLPAEERQTSFTQMMEIALDTAVKMASSAADQRRRVWSEGKKTPVDGRADRPLTMEIRPGKRRFCGKLCFRCFAENPSVPFLNP